MALTDLIGLPDEILLEIFLYLATPDVINFMRSHSRFTKVGRDRSLWIKVNNPPDKFEILDDIINKFIHDGTTFFRSMSNCYGANRGLTRSLPPSLLCNLRTQACNLSQLFLINQRIDGKEFRLTQLPEGLKTLSLRHSSVDVDSFTCIPNENQPYNIEETPSFFKGMASHFTKLEVLDLSGCHWIVALDLVHLRKLETLEKLLLSGCRFVGSRKSVYSESAAILRVQWRRVFSCIAQSGFNSLRFLDLNNTDISRNQFIPAFFRHRTPSIMEHLLVGHYDLEYSWPMMDHNLDTSFLPHAVNLRTLDISGFTYRNTLVANLAGCTKLENLFIYSTRLLPNIITQLREIPTTCDDFQLHVSDFITILPNAIVV